MDSTLAFVSATFGLPRTQTRAFVSFARPISTARPPTRQCAFIIRASATEETPAAPEVPKEEAAPAEAPVAVAQPDADPVAAAGAPETEGDEQKGEKKRRNRRVGGTRQKREVTLKLEDMTVGQEIEGVVKSTTAYGAFIGDMGTPTDGLLHVSQLTNGFVENVTDIVNVGDKVTVRVLAIDMEKGNFSLSMKPPMTEEEEAAAAERRSGGGQRGGGGGGGGGGGAAAAKWNAFKFDPDVFVDVKVISVTGFGAFCRLLNAEGNEDDNAPTDGLIHISALSDDHVSDVSSILSVGQVVKARVTDTDRKRNRISLSLRQSKAVEDNAFAEDMEASRSKQPDFKTSMELAFERAKKTV